MELNQPDSSQLILKINDLKNRADNLIQQFNIKEKKQKINQIDEQLQDPSIWKNLEKTRTLNEEKSEIIELTEPFETLPNQIEQADFFLNIAVEENDIDAIKSANCEIQQIEKVIHKLEFQRMFAGKMDSNNAYLDIQAGSGGTEAQDWAEMLFRMYLRFFDRKNMKLLKFPKGMWLALKVQAFILKEIMFMVGLKLSSEFIVWYANHHLMQTIKDTLLLLQFLFHQRLMIVLRLKSIHLI